MIDYGLALKLKTAGFPQGDNPRQQMLKEEGDPYEPNNRTMWVDRFTPEYIEEMKDKIVYIPTLEELIKACGENLALLGQQEGTWCAYEKWFLPEAISNDMTRSSTPEESVTKLWLALKK